MTETATFEPRIVGFLCNWCSYAGADLAGTSRTAYPPNIRVVRVPCSGRVDPLFVARALKEGADGVLVLGCHPGDCHYSDGNYYTRRRFAVMRELLVFLGLEPERIQLDWVSASEGARFARVVSEFTEALRGLGPRHVAADHSLAPPAASPPPPFVRDHTSITEQLRTLAVKLLSEKTVDVVLGWEQGTRGYRPLFARTVEQAQRLLVDAKAMLNLATYLRGLTAVRAAVVVRPADMRAVNVLLHEGQIKRENVYLIGIGGDAGRGPLPASAYDALLGRALETIDGGMPPFPAVKEIDSWPAAKRTAFWTAQFDNCLRCYACRQACPLCYCQECMAEQLEPAWQSIAIETDEKAFFHLTRAFHLAGRCTGCKACVDACPAGIPLGLINQKVATVVSELFGGYDTGLDPARALPFTTFRKDEVLSGCES
jgi:coenzyme F420-reducing hydrogenase delta subunit/ferredoxin